MRKIIESYHILLINVLSGVFLVSFTSLHGQSSLEQQMEELNRLQERLESLQNSTSSSPNMIKDENLEKNPSTNTRFHIINMDYQVNVPNTNTITVIKGPIKIDTVTGETWRYVVNGYDEYWKKIGE